MKRTISMMVGKGSVNHNNRKFHAKNTSPERSCLNHSYYNDSIRDVYHELFDEALARFNEKQTRSDRRIENYFEKIRSGKQEKPFHEIILQIGNCDDMNAQTENGHLAEKILDEYMQSFQQRNPNLRVFAAHLHMDEATPHLHIDFVPFTTGSTRGLETRVSLKQALAAQGFTGGTRQETEWNQWVQAEKVKLAAVMERHGIEWEQKGTHDKHLSVLEYEKKVRISEVAELNNTVLEKQKEVSGVNDALQLALTNLTDLQGKKELIESEIRKYDQPEWSLPEPPALMTAKAYKEKIAHPLINKLKDALRSAVARYHSFVGQLSDLKNALREAQRDVNSLKERVHEEREINQELKTRLRDYGLIQKFLGRDKTESILEQAKAAEVRHRLSKGQYTR